jgi:hypothetical protein
LHRKLVSLLGRTEGIGPFFLELDHVENPCICVDSGNLLHFGRSRASQDSNSPKLGGRHPFIVALRSNVIDDIFDGIDGNDKEFLDKLLRDGKIERVKKGDHIRVEKVYERKIGLEFAECTLYRKGRQEKRVWVFSAMISQLCSKVK